jgi:hypothetical protein
MIRQGGVTLVNTGENPCRPDWGDSDIKLVRLTPVRLGSRRSSKGNGPFRRRELHYSRSSDYAIDPTLLEEVDFLRSRHVGDDTCAGWRARPIAATAATGP